MELKVFFLLIILNALLAGDRISATKVKDIFKGKMDKCVDRVTKEFKAKIPEVALELEALLREVNLPLYELPLTALIKHPNSKTDLEESRVMTDQVMAGIGSCKQLVVDLEKAAKNTKCADDLLEMMNIFWRDYDEKVAAVYPKFDQLMGYKEACQLII